MAYLKVERKKSGTYLSILESYREGKQSKKRVLYNLGKAENYSAETLRRIGEQLYRLGGGNLQQLLGPAVREISRQNYGYYQVYRQLLRDYGFPRFFQGIVKKHQLSYDLYNAVLLMLLDRLQEPVSKLSSWLYQEEYVGPAKVELQWLYRSLDKLSQYSEQIQERIYRQGRDLFNSRLDLVFYDVTTFYFDSEVEEVDKLRQKGFGKDGKIGKTQLLFGMLIDEEKRPIAYQIYDGKTYEGHTFQSALEILKKRYNIGQIIVVADRGMMNKENLKSLTEDLAYDFILGERLKNLPGKVQEKLLDIEQYTQEWIDANQEDENGEAIKIRYRQIEHDNKIIIGTYSAKRAKRDAQKREEKLAKAEKMLQNPSQIKKKAARYFLKNTKDETYELNQEKIQTDARFDGFLAISANSKKVDIPTVLQQYKNLYQIEHCFRTFKSYLETRPMFHWNDERIKGHICLCYMAYTLQNHLQLALKAKGLPHSEAHLRRMMRKMQVSLIEQEEEQFYLRAELDEDQKNLLRILKLKQLPNLIPKNELEKYINIAK